MSKLTRGLAHLLCSVLSLYAGFSVGKSYCLLILGRDKSGSCPLGQPRPRGILSIMGPFCSICLHSLSQFTFCLSFLCSLCLSLRRLFLLQMVLRELGGLGKIVPLSSVYVEGVY